MNRCFGRRGVFRLPGTVERVRMVRDVGKGALSYTC